MTLFDIYQQQAAYVRDSGFSVVVCESMETVAIEGADSEGFFLEGSEAAAFIAEARDVWNKSGYLYLEDVFLAHAKPYIDAI